MSWIQKFHIKGSHCPSCGNRSVRVFDKGLLRYWRMALLDSRIYCPECKCTWRLNRPERVSKIKRKTHQETPKTVIYQELPFDPTLLKLSHEQAENQAKTWFTEGKIHIALHMEKQVDFSQKNVGVLMDLYTHLKKMGGGLIICHAPDVVKDALWSANVSFLIYSDERISSDSPWNSPQDIDPRITTTPSF